MASFWNLFGLWLALLLGSRTASPVTPRNAAEMRPRAGPSGFAVQPSGGTEVVNLGGTGAIYVEYQGVEGTLSDGSTYRTLGIDLTLHDSTGTQADIMLVQGFKPNPTTSVSISGYFTPPLGACGTFNLVMTEHQYIYNTVISFQAAAPQISIQCGPVQ